MKGRLARLERAAGKLIVGPRCPRCGGTPGGVARAAIVSWNGVGSQSVFGPDGLCVECGAVPLKVINFVTPYGGKVPYNRATSAQ